MTFEGNLIWKREHSVALQLRELSAASISSVESMFLSLISPGHYGWDETDQFTQVTCLHSAWWQMLGSSQKVLKFLKTKKKWKFLEKEFQWNFYVTNRNWSISIHLLPSKLYFAMKSGNHYWLPPSILHSEYHVLHIKNFLTLNWYISYRLSCQDSMEAS